MSWVGPRPEVPEYVDQVDPLWRLVLEARPGLTDPTTLLLRSEERLLAGFEGPAREHFYRRRLLPFKLKTSLHYLRHRTAASDVGILLRTAWAILRPRAADPEAVRELLSDEEDAPAGDSSSSE